MLRLGVVEIFMSPIGKALKPTPKSEPALELHSRAAPSVEAHHPSDGPDAGRNSGRRRLKKNV